MAKKKKTMNELTLGEYVCPKCDFNFYRPIPCPKCAFPIQYGISQPELSMMFAFLKKDALNKVSLYLFGDALCYDLIDAPKKPGKRKPKGKPGVKK